MFGYDAHILGFRGVKATKGDIFQGEKIVVQWGSIRLFAKFRYYHYYFDENQRLTYIWFGFIHDMNSLIRNFDDTRLRLLSFFGWDLTESLNC